MEGEDLSGTTGRFWDGAQETWLDVEERPLKEEHARYSTQLLRGTTRKTHKAIAFHREQDSAPWIQDATKAVLVDDNSR